MRVLLTAACAAAFAFAADGAGAAHVHVRTHHSDHHSRETKQLFRVQTRKSLFARATKRVALDVWSVRVASSSGTSNGDDASDPLVDAKVYTTPTAMKALQRAGGGHQTRIHVSSQRGGHSKTVTFDNSTQNPSDWMLDIVDEEKDLGLRIDKDRADVAACLNRTTGFLEQLKQAAATTPYTKSAFFDCFRPADQVFAFLDAMAAQNSGVMTKLPNVSTTFEGRAIPAYRLSTTVGSAPTKKVVYVQALIHAREWQAGSSTFFTMAHMVDELRHGSAHAKKLFDEFDWYFVPIVNIDGYVYTATGDRYWRTNRRLLDAKGNSIAGVDLNRNFGPEKFFNLEPEIVDEETYPGVKPLSEPSTAGIFRFVTSLQNLVGVVDMHTFGGEVLRPFSNQAGEAPTPFGPQLKKITDRVTETLSEYADQPYMSKTGADLYKAYGCFDDSMLLTTNYTVPAITIEVEGEDFIVPQSSIRRVGKSIYHGLLRFAREAVKYQEVVASAASSDDSSDDSN